MAENLLEKITGRLAEHIALAEQVKDNADGNDLARHLCALVLQLIASCGLWENALGVLLDMNTVGACSRPEAALQLKDSGNNAFFSGHFEEAAELYSDSLVHVNEQQHAACAAKVYNNRALCWLRLHRPQAAYADAALALRLCQNPNPAENPKLDPNIAAKARHRLASAAAAGANPDSDPEEPCQLEAGAHVLPASVRMDVSAEGGRALAAARAFEPGQVVYGEPQPWVSVLLRPHRKTVSWCVRRAGRGSHAVWACYSCQRRMPPDCLAFAWCMVCPSGAFDLLTVL